VQCARLRSGYFHKQYVKMGSLEATKAAFASCDGLRAAQFPTPWARPRQWLSTADGAAKNPPPAVAAKSFVHSVDDRPFITSAHCAASYRGV